MPNNTLPTQFMKNLVAFLLIGLFTVTVVQGQIDMNSSQELNIGTDIPIDEPENPTPNARLNMPSVIDENPLDEKDQQIHMLPEKELVRAGHNLDLNKKVGEKEKKGSKEHFGDMYLGDVTTSSKFVGVVCRDHEYVDGDRVKIYANDEVVDHNMLLTGGFKGINLDLKKGFNRLDFEALNQGSSGPNTAQVDVYDENGEKIYSSKWNLSTGSKASLIVIKNDD
jgi:hypothetical protein